MKLSQKLLSLAGVALADYACCPYDDWGVPLQACLDSLPEKTPFAWNMHPTTYEEMPEEWRRGVCKAWEANVDASYDGGSDEYCPDNQDWGSCGFQRHFPWANADQAASADDILGHANIASVTLSQIENAGSMAQSDNLGGSTFTLTMGAAGAYNIGGSPFLGGVCKLFVPVDPEDIVNTQIAGVHVSGGGPSQFAARANGPSGASQDGTAYCFSVVNVAEANSNTNHAHNANVAGDHHGTNGAGNFDGLEQFSTDVFGGMSSLQRQAGYDNIFSYGSDLGQGRTSETDVLTSLTDTDHALGWDSRAGANFDVVVHLRTGWCEETWTVQDMQLADDFDSGRLDYPLDPANDFSHAHMDVMDKRFGRSEAWNPVFTESGGLMTHAGSGIDGLRWPNSGAWAGFYSFVFCAKPEAGGRHTGDATHNSKYIYLNDGLVDERHLVLSVSHSDYRNDDCSTASFRGNIRQVGTLIDVCGPGTLPDTDADGARCTWNWNYDGHADFGSPVDPENFFDRNDPNGFKTWSSVRRRRDAEVVARTDAANDIDAPISNFDFKIQTRDHNDEVMHAQDNSYTFDIGTDNSTSHIVIEAVRPGENHTRFSLRCGTGASDAADPQRDQFPDCFFGDEIQFEVVHTFNSTLKNFTGPHSHISSWFTRVQVI
jgi:hypothetical protein